MVKTLETEIVLVDVKKLKHIEGFSRKRADWLMKKIMSKGKWDKPVALDDKHYLVLDGQHRMEVALALGLKKIPAVKYAYAEVEVWSLRPKYSFDWTTVVECSLRGDIYPYKTVKHRFPTGIPACSYDLDQLR
jgi:L-serine kinase (ADP)